MTDAVQKPITPADAAAKVMPSTPAPASATPASVSAQEMHDKGLRAVLNNTGFKARG